MPKKQVSKRGFWGTMWDGLVGSPPVVPPPVKKRRAQKALPFTPSEQPRTITEAIEQEMLMDGRVLVKKGKRDYEDMARALFMAKVVGIGEMGQAMALADLQNDPEFKDLNREIYKRKLRDQLESGGLGEEDMELEELINPDRGDFSSELEQFEQTYDRMVALSDRLAGMGGSHESKIDTGELLKMGLNLVLGFLSKGQVPSASQSHQPQIQAATQTASLQTAPNQDAQTTTPIEPNPAAAGTPAIESPVPTVLPPAAPDASPYNNSEFMGLLVSQATDLIGVPPEQAASQAVKLIEEVASGRGTLERLKIYGTLQVFTSLPPNEVKALLVEVQNNTPVWRDVTSFLLSNPAWLEAFRGKIAEYMGMSEEEEEEEG